MEVLQIRMVQIQELIDVEARELVVILVEELTMEAEPMNVTQTIEIHKVQEQTPIRIQIAILITVILLPQIETEVEARIIHGAEVETPILQEGIAQVLLQIEVVQVEIVVEVLPQAVVVLAVHAQEGLNLQALAQNVEGDFFSNQLSMSSTQFSVGIAH